MLNLIFGFRFLSWSLDFENSLLRYIWLALEVPLFGCDDGVIDWVLGWCVFRLCFVYVIFVSIMEFLTKYFYYLY